jgi:hypothetical protein
LNGIDNGSRIGKACCFEQNGIKLVTTFHQLSKSPYLISAYRTTHTAIVHGNQVFRCFQRFSNCNIIIIEMRNSVASFCNHSKTNIPSPSSMETSPKFIFQDANFPLILFFQNVIHKGSLASSKKTSNDRNGRQGFGRSRSSSHGGGGRRWK